MSSLPGDHTCLAKLDGCGERGWNGCRGPGRAAPNAERPARQASYRLGMADSGCRPDWRLPLAISQMNRFNEMGRYSQVLAAVKGGDGAYWPSCAASSRRSAVITIQCRPSVPGRLGSWSARGLVGARVAKSSQYGWFSSAGAFALGPSSHQGCETGAAPLMSREVPGRGGKDRYRPGGVRRPGCQFVTRSGVLFSFALLVFLGPIPRPAGGAVRLTGRTTQS